MWKRKNSIRDLIVGTDDGIIVGKDNVKEIVVDVIVDKPIKVGDAVRENGLSFHLFVDSAEGIRAPIDRTIASRRADRAMEKFAHPA
jgi:hypothetical protein